MKKEIKIYREELFSQGLWDLLKDGKARTTRQISIKLGESWYYTYKKLKELEQKKGIEEIPSKEVILWRWLKK